MTSAVQDPVQDPKEMEPQPTRGPRPENLASDSAADPPPRFGPAGGADLERVATPYRGGHEREIDREEAAAERGLRGLVGGGSSQVTVTAAMRARDAARPTPEDLAASAEELVIVRRGWTPREELPRPVRHR